MLNILKAKRLRIAHLTLGLEVGGQEKLLVEFARHADRRRFELLFISLTDRGLLAEHLEEFGWPVIALKEPPGLRPMMIFRLARLLQKLGIDIVHTHDDKPLLYGVPGARLAGVPGVVHTHHHGPLPSIKRRHTLALACLARWIDRFVCVSNASRRWLTQEGIPAGKLATVWNGINLDRFPYSGPCPGGPVVSVGRLSSEKDQAGLFQALALVRRELPSARLEIAGAGPCRGELEKLAGALNLGDAVRFLGNLADIPALLKRGSIFVLSSLTEGISLTLLEAMASGLPIVATQVGGNPEVVLAGKTGLLVPPRNPRALADAILHLLGDPGQQQKLGLAGRGRVEEFFDVRRMVAHYEDIYQAVYPESLAPAFLRMPREFSMCD